MHHRMELIMPHIAKEKIAKTVESIMAPFWEDNESNYSFFDYYEIGGRYSGDKIVDSIDPDQLKQFFKELNDRKVTVSSVVFGKETLMPEIQAPMVDAVWREMFPGKGNICPLFSHSGQGQSEADICTLKDLPTETKAGCVLIAGSYKDKKPEAVYLVHKMTWNGVSWINSFWDGKVRTALDAWISEVKTYSDDYKKAMTPTDDWLVITIDYHS